MNRIFVIWSLIIFCLLSSCIDREELISRDAHLRRAGNYLEDYHGIYLDSDEESSQLGGVLYNHHVDIEGKCKTESVILKNKMELSHIDARISPKDARADEEFKAEIIGIFRNQQGRLVLDTTPFWVNNEDKGQVKYIHNGIGVFKQNKSQNYGNASFAVNSNEVSSSPLQIEVHSGQPNDFEIEMSADHKWADGRSFLKIRTSLIMDDLGNQITDGTVVTFISKTTSGEVFTMSAPTIGGVALVYMQHPIQSCFVSITAHCGSAMSLFRERMNFEPYTNDLPFRLVGSKLEIGPVKTTNNTLMPDGTPVEVIFNPDEEAVKTIIYLERGEYVLSLENYLINNDYNKVRLECSGASTEISIL